jgi:hypothetical protein
MVQTLYHRLILPADANHKNTLYAGSSRHGHRNRGSRFASHAGASRVGVDRRSLGSRARTSFGTSSWMSANMPSLTNRPPSALHSPIKAKVYPSPPLSRSKAS